MKKTVKAVNSTPIPSINKEIGTQEKQFKIGPPVFELTMEAVGELDEFIIAVNQAEKIGVVSYKEAYGNFVALLRSKLNSHVKK